jgi:hypothetical protein
MYKQNCFNLTALKNIHHSISHARTLYIYESASGHDSSAQVVRNFQLVERITVVTSHFFDSSLAT